MPEFMARAMVHLAGPDDTVSLYCSQMAGVKKCMQIAVWSAAVADSYFSWGNLLTARDGSITKAKSWSTASASGVLSMMYLPKLTAGVASSESLSCGS